jgi:Na+-driven multidrug efflux pump
MTFMGQNIGARKPDRVRKTFIYGTLCGIAIGTVMGVGIFALGRPILHIFLPEDLAAVEIGILRMQFIVLLYGLCSFKGTLTTGLQAFGYAIISTLNGIFSTLVLRIIWMNLIYPHFESINNIYLCYVVSWMVEAIIGAIAFAIIYKKKIKQLSNPIEKAVI